MAVEKRKDKAKKRVVQIEAVGQAHIRATFNNIVISMTNSTGQVITWASAGKMGSKAQRKTLHTLLKWQLRIALHVHLN